MTPLPLFLILTISVGLGIFLGVCYLRGIRKPVVIGAHFLLGAAALETTAVLLHGPPSGEVITPPASGTLILGLLGAAMLTGLTAALLRDKRRISMMVLASHGGIGLIAFALVCLWALRA